jgi:hemerythrin-like domain-containing protein
VSAAHHEGRSSGRVNRRAIMFGAGGVAVGAVGAGIAAAAAPSAAAVTPAQLDAVAKKIPLTEDLMTEHGLLIRIILVYRETISWLQTGKAVPQGPVHDTAEVIENYFHDFHEPLEEGFVFPPLAKGSLSSMIDTLLLQHARGREQTQLILDATSGSREFVTGSNRQQLLEAMSNFAGGYEPHESREDTVVYPAFRAGQSATNIVQLADHFDALQKQQFGANGFQEMLSRVDATEQILGIYDLAQFTPPQVV